MAKKTPSTATAPSTPAPRRRRTTKPAAAAAAAAAPGSNGNGGVEGHTPTADEIAQEAYRRYLSRGGQHGSDFDDWIQAERELTTRRSR